MQSAAAVRNPRLAALFGVDVRSLALLRLGLGTLLLVDLFQRSRWIGENYGERGLMPESGLQILGVAPFPAVHLLHGSVAFQGALFLVAAVFAGLLLVGWRTRLACIASWYLLVSLHTRNPLILDGGDLILVMLLFWSMFLPLGATFSLDARQRAWRGGAVVLSPASAALLVQFFVVYFGAGITKTGPEWRVDGTAISYVMNETYWTRPLGDLLAGYPGPMRVLTHAALGFEVLAPLVLFSPLATGPVRCLMIPAFWIFQHSLGLTIQLGVFPWICSVAILPFVPTLLWERVADLPRPLPGLSTLAARPAGPDAVGASSTLSRVGNGALLLLVVVVFYSAIAMVEPRLVPRPLLRALMVPRLTQSWAAYAPSPGHLDFRLTREGSLENGGEVDLDVRVRGERWRRVAAIHRDYRFKMYVQAIQEWDVVPLRERYGDWLCREWNAETAGGDRLEAVRFRIEAREILPPDGRGPLRRRLLVERPC